MLRARDINLLSGIHNLVFGPPPESPCPAICRALRPSPNDLTERPNCLLRLPYPFTPEPGGAPRVSSVSRLC